MDIERFNRNIEGFKEISNNLIKENWSLEIHEISDFYEYFALYFNFIMSHSHELTYKQRKEFDNLHLKGLEKLIKIYAEKMKNKRTD